MWRARAATATLQDCFLPVSSQLEDWGCPEGKVAGVTQTIFTTKDSAVSALLERWTLGPSLLLGLHVSHTVALLCGLLAFYTLVPVLFVMFRASSCLSRALALECERWRGEGARVCAPGQEVEDASTALPGHLYAGPWLEEDVPARRLRLKLMLGGSCTKAHVAVGGLGDLNAQSCMHVVQRWFSYLNVFMNIQ
ncbi:uncharacterized protein LOC117648419 [Thrips palmi]|uniref:Uncharacterized protein LOC117648419 n=1 Tax=Thrips palmi TaxID=161013 RepID=A0A6P8Z8K7_THRPL|nr:uncharacterized protein LOC117648419 [Thrips palmi]